ncbi:hypothetical protein [Oceanobacillus kapialis]|uniref:hypothetical protein n=1 Tax=Oceanobacillus kapialis TaxID=481353 RepID=UPI00384AA7E0
MIGQLLWSIDLLSWLIGQLPWLIGATAWLIEQHLPICHHLNSLPHPHKKTGNPHTRIPC